MSTEALNYVDKARTAPNGESITVREKAVLHILANAHNSKKRAAWPKISTMADGLNLSTRTVREILAGCLRKQIIWREQRFENGSQLSNNWRFTEIDGEETETVRKANERLVERGKKGQQRRRKEQNCRENSQVPQASTGGTAETCSPPLRNPADPHCGIPQTPTAESRRPKNLVLEPLLEPVLEPLVAKPATGPVDFSEEAKRLQLKLEHRRRRTGPGSKPMQRADFASLVKQEGAGR